MIITKEIGNDDVAKVYIARMEKGLIEFAESRNPQLPREEKWVLILSCMVGCPVRCRMCDAGRSFVSGLTNEEIFEQIDYLVEKRFPDRRIPVKKFKIQFTRMGEPAFNPAVLDVLQELPKRYNAPGLIPSISTVGPKHTQSFFRQLKETKEKLYQNGKFQLQFSIHTTDENKRDRLIPVPKMSFREIAEYGKQFFATGDRKITLNFIAMEEYPIDPAVIQRFFDPSRFLVKLTPLNPTRNAERNALRSKLDPANERSVAPLAEELRSFDFDTIVSIGEIEENQIGSNCGQFVSGE
jgi:23S rRNA (adenine2503-C2)-methyltransferase